MRMSERAVLEMDLKIMSGYGSKEISRLGRAEFDRQVSEKTARLRELSK